MQTYRGQYGKSSLQLSTLCWLSFLKTLKSFVFAGCMAALEAEHYLQEIGSHEDKSESSL